MTSQPMTLTDRFRAELKRLLASGWSERDLAEGIGRSSQGKLQGWLRSKSPTRPPMDALEQLAETRGITVTRLVGRLYGEDVPGGDLTWADIARQLIDDPVALESFAAELEPRELTRLSLALLAFHQERNG